MRVVNLFGGVEVGRLACKRAMLPVTSYMSSEIDEKAMTIAKRHHPDIHFIGNVKSVSVDSLGMVDLLMGGSPCQGFSTAGTKRGFDDPRSGLLMDFVRIKNLVSPEYFLLENVMMSKKNVIAVTELLGVEPVVINSSSFSPQDRSRLYWTNIPIVPIPETNYLLGDIVGFNTHPVPDLETIRLAVSEFVRRDFSIKIRPCGRIRVHANDYKKSGISELSNVCNPNGKSVSIIASHRPKYYTTSPFQIIELNRNQVEQLQTLPIGHLNGLSERDVTKYAGNGWTTDVIAHILKGIK